jgi:8-oxo-(d)GTP phosphatase
VPRPTTGGRGAVVEAAGAVVWRRGADERVEVLLIHRPKYDDWSFPKGKLEPGEQAPGAAVREVREETGIRVRLGPPLPVVRYPLASGADKVVRYWAATPRDSGDSGDSGDKAQPGDSAAFEPNHEVDAVGWFGLDEGLRQLTHPHDRALLDHLRPVSTRPLVVLRHAHAVNRARWSGPDIDRPLSEEGTVEAEHLLPTLDAYGIRRVVSSPARRCVATVLPYAAHHQLEVGVDPAFAEEVAAALVREPTLRLCDGSAPTVLCTHRPTVPAVLEALGVEPIFLEPAELAVVHLHDGAPLAVEHLGEE